jgi:hypothetical protein
MSRAMAGGRLGNQIIRNIAISLLAEKSNLHVIYSSHELISQLGIDLFCGTKNHHTSMNLTDENYMLVYEQPFITRHFGDIYAFFQTKVQNYKLLASIYKIFEYVMGYNYIKACGGCGNKEFIKFEYKIKHNLGINI